MTHETLQAGAKQFNDSLRSENYTPKIAERSCGVAPWRRPLISQHNALTEPAASRAHAPIADRKEKRVLETRRPKCSHGGPSSWGNASSAGSRAVKGMGGIETEISQGCTSHNPQMFAAPLPARRPRAGGTGAVRIRQVLLPLTDGRIRPGSLPDAIVVFGREGKERGAEYCRTDRGATC